MIYTTLNKIREHNPCPDGWAKLLRHLGKTHADDEPLSLATILTSNGLEDALWCLQTVENHTREIRLYAVWCARQVQHLMTDPCSVAALDVAERYANGEASREELSEARAAAWTAAGAAARTARAAAWDAAEAAVEAAAWAAWNAAWEAAETTAGEARAAQAAEFRRRFCEEVTA